MASKLLSDWPRTLALLAVTVLCIYTIYLEHEVKVAVPAEIASIQSGLNQKTEALGNSVSAKFDSINAKLGAVTDALTDKRTGILIQSLPKALANIAAATNTMAQDLALERKAFVPQSQAFQTMAENGTAFIKNANGAITDLRASEKQFNALLGAVSPELVAHIANNFDDTSTHLAATSANVEKISTNLGDTTGHLDHMSADADTYVHQFLYPTTPKKALHFIEDMIGLSGPIVIHWAK